MLQTNLCVWGSCTVNTTHNNFLYLAEWASLNYENENWQNQPEAKQVLYLSPIPPTPVFVKQGAKVPLPLHIIMNILLSYIILRKSYIYACVPCSFPIPHTNRSRQGCVSLHASALIVCILCTFMLVKLESRVPIYDLLGLRKPLMS